MSSETSWEANGQIPSIPGGNQRLNQASPVNDAENPLAQNTVEEAVSPLYHLSAQENPQQHHMLAALSPSLPHGFSQQTNLRLQSHLGYQLSPGARMGERGEVILPLSHNVPLDLNIPNTSASAYYYAHSSSQALQIKRSNETLPTTMDSAVIQQEQRKNFNWSSLMQPVEEGGLPPIIPMLREIFMGFVGIQLVVVLASFIFENFSIGIITLYALISAIFAHLEFRNSSYLLCTLLHTILSVLQLFSLLGDLKGFTSVIYEDSIKKFLVIADVPIAILFSLISAAILVILIRIDSLQNRKNLLNLSSAASRGSMPRTTNSTQRDDRPPSIFTRINLAYQKLWGYIGGKIKGEAEMHFEDTESKAGGVHCNGMTIEHDQGLDDDRVPWDSDSAAQWGGTNDQGDLQRRAEVNNAFSTTPLAHEFHSPVGSVKNGQEGSEYFATISDIAASGKDHIGIETSRSRVASKIRCLVAAKRKLSSG